MCAKKTQPKPKQFEERLQTGDRVKILVREKGTLTQWTGINLSLQSILKIIHKTEAEVWWSWSPCARDLPPELRKSGELEPIPGPWSHSGKEA